MNKKSSLPGVQRLFAPQPERLLFIHQYSVNAPVTRLAELFRSFYYSNLFFAGLFQQCIDLIEDLVFTFQILQTRFL